MEEIKLSKKCQEENGYIPSAKNPNGKGDIEHKSPEQIFKSIQEKEEKIEKIISEIEGLI